MDRSRLAPLVLLFGLACSVGGGEDVAKTPGASPPAHATPSDQTWRGLWPQDSREEAERAQLAADAGDDRYSWQLGADGEKVVMRYAREELAWAKPRGLAIVVPEHGEGWLRRWQLIGCAPGVANPDYPDVDCAPRTNRTYPAVYVTVERLMRRESDGIWIVTGVEPTVVHQPVPVSEDQVRRFVGAFLLRRIGGSGAKEYLSHDGRRKFGANGSLGPLYGYGRAGGLPYHRYEIAFVHGPHWPSAGFEVGVRLFAKSGVPIDEETLFVGPWHELSDEHVPLLVHGGRTGLSGP